MTASWIPELIGACAGSCTTISLVPQLVRIYRRKSAADLSLAMFLVFGAGIVLWLVYGVVVHSPSVIGANAASLALCVGILALSIRYRNRKG